MKPTTAFLKTLLAAALGLAACQPAPYALTNQSYKKQVRAYARSLRTVPLERPADAGWRTGDYWVGTTNLNLRKPNYVIIHHTAQDSTAQTLKTFTLPRTQVSAHYVIGRDGKVYHMLHDYLRAWHAGVSRWGNNTDLNSSSIGIELDNNGREPFAEDQINSLLLVLAHLKKTHGIPTANFIGHADIAPTRKNDPNPLFPWKRLAQHGYGLWYDESVLSIPPALPDTVPASLTDSSLVARHSLPAGFNPAEALRIIGYDVRNLPAAIRAFKLHFIQTDISDSLSVPDKRVLHNLYQKYL